MPSTRSRGGVVLNRAGIPQPWLDELYDNSALIVDPDGRAAVLDAMAYAVRRRLEINAAVLSDMLELSEAARLWALNAQEMDE
ncbi:MULTISPECIES: hypothetical protein [Pseudomonas]|uniref:hypothetical protein n=1 Tax=Pseudomonas TaxID=286 RepID=UPI000B35AD17|nr:MULTISPECIES: hypothetical protein [Pseudomonas]PMY63110.1 hypothetical protein C1Y31_20365 [Pseudomonas sp. FW305-25]PMY66039.1 hypothetical protein C1Y32_22070 [Pseudomonas sp. FW126-L8]PNA73928.1 hypothetical protein C1Y33_26090 [Pseudomonas sp. FW305-76]